MKGRWLGIGLAVVAGVILVWGLLTYRPPLIAPGSRNLPELVHDFFAYSWFFSKAVWLENTRRAPQAEAALARAAWYRPALVEEILGVPPGDSYRLAVEFEKRGLLAYAGRLLARAARQPPAPEVSGGADESARLRGILIYCASLEQWDQVEGILRNLPTERLADLDGFYWRGKALLELGRPGEALPLLDQSVALASSPPDAHFQRFRALRALGRPSPALAALRRAVELAPGHQWAVAELARLAPAARPADLKPPQVPLRANVANRILTTGFDPPPSRLKGGEALRCALYYEVLTPQPCPLVAELSLRGEHRLALVRRQELSGERWDPGCVRRVSWDVTLPQDIVPGAYRLQVEFPVSDDLRLHLVGSRQERISLGEVVILPEVFSLPHFDQQLNEKFGDGVFNLRQSTVIAGYDRVSVSLDRSPPAEAFGIISYTQNSVSIPQGTIVAEIELETVGDEVFRFPVRLGVHTADLWLADREPEERKHSGATLYRSREVSSGGETAVASSYSALFRLPHPAALRKVTFRSARPGASALFIQNMFLIPPAGPVQIQAGDRDSFLLLGALNKSTFGMEFFLDKLLIIVALFIAPSSNSTRRGPNDEIRMTKSEINPKPE